MSGRTRVQRKQSGENERDVAPIAPAALHSASELSTGDRAPAHQLGDLQLHAPALLVGPPDDAFEVEADRVADAVMAGAVVTPLAAADTARLQRTPDTAPPEERDGLPPDTTWPIPDSGPSMGEELVEGAVAVGKAIAKTPAGRELARKLRELGADAVSTCEGLTVVISAAAATVATVIAANPSLDATLPLAKLIPLDEIWPGLKAANLTIEGPPQSPSKIFFEIAFEFGERGPRRRGDLAQEARATETDEVRRFQQGLRYAEGTPEAREAAAQQAVYEDWAQSRIPAPHDLSDPARLGISQPSAAAEPKPNPFQLTRPTFGTAPGDERLPRLVPKLRLDEPFVMRAASAEVPALAPPSVHATVGRGGESLGAEARAFMEARLGHDFGHVRVHTDAAAAQSAQAVSARAYTVGRDIVFGAGQYQPGTDAGRRLIAHELAHVVQQTAVTPFKTQSQPLSVMVQRKGLDPKNQHAWSYLGSRRESMQDIFLATVSKAPEASLQLEQAIARQASPSNATERSAILAQLETLVRLNAIGLMASHRSSITFKRDEMLQPGSKEGGRNSDTTTRDIRLAAANAVKLRAVKNYLTTSQQELDLARMSGVRGEAFEDALLSLFEATKYYQGVGIQQTLRHILNTVQRPTQNLQQTYRAAIFSWGSQLADLRAKQIQGIDTSLYFLFDAFPFFTQLDPEAVIQEPHGNNRSLLSSVAAAYTDLINNVDKSIANIGSGDIPAFSLPIAVRTTRASLPLPLQTLLDQAVEEQKVTQFWTSMGLNIGQLLLIFIPVVGPVLAAGVGIGTLIADVSEALDRYTLSQASTNPDGTVLDASGPSKLEWFWLAAQGVLTLADLSSLGRELTSLRSTEGNVPNSTTENEPDLSGDPLYTPAHESKPLGQEGDFAQRQDNMTANGKPQQPKLSEGEREALSELERITNTTIPVDDVQGGTGWRLVTLEPGTVLYSLGNAERKSMRWGAFQEESIAEYMRGNQLGVDWYTKTPKPGYDIPLYEWRVEIQEPTVVAMSKIAPQPKIGIPAEVPAKHQYYNPAGLGVPIRGRILGWIRHQP